MNRLKSMLRMADDQQDNRSLWGISWMCFFWGTASVMVFTLLPTFLTEELHATKMQVGFIEGFAIFLAFIAKVFSGVLSDFWKKRRPLILFGTASSIIVKSMFALAMNVWWVFIAKSMDRLIKGIRSAPTDALIADLSGKKRNGTAYGIRQSLYTFGYVMGSVMAASFMFMTNHHYRLVFWLSIVPATAAFLLLTFFVKESHHRDPLYKNTPWHWRDIKHLPLKFWHLLGVTSLLMMARFSEAFLNLRARELGWQIVALPLLLVAYDMVSASMAFPMGKWADRMNRHRLFLMGIVVLIITNLVVISVGHWSGILIGMMLAGLHMGMTQGLIQSMIAESTLPHLRGTAFALYYLTTGMAVFMGNTFAGYLSDQMGVVGAFWGGLVFTTLSAIYCYWLVKNLSASRI